MRKQLSKEGIRRIITLLMVSCFIFSFYVIYGVTIATDSEGYINMVTSREPVYPIYLALLRSIFIGKDIYLDIAVILQNVLMIFAIYYSTETLWKRFSKSYLTLIGLYMIHFGTLIMCQYASEFMSVLCNNILTEGLTVSLWLIFLTLVIEVSLEFKWKKFFVLICLMTIMIDIRKQMAVTYLIFFVTFMICRFKKDNKKIFILRALICIVSIFISITVAVTGNKFYNMAVHGSFSKNTRDMNLVLTTTLYVADPEDAALIEDESVRELFIETMDILEKKECNYSFAGTGLRELEEHYEKHYDMITCETTASSFVNYAIQNGYKSGIMAEQEADRMSTVIVRSLFIDNAVKYLKVYFASFIHGMIKTILKRGIILDVIAIIGYIFYIFLLVYNIRTVENKEKGIAGGIVLISILINVGVVAALIFCDTRYMIYNLAIFYVMGIILFESFVGSIITFCKNKNAVSPKS